jgi:hypothetical protein
LTIFEGNGDANNLPESWTAEEGYSGTVTITEYTGVRTGGSGGIEHVELGIENRVGSMKKYTVNEDKKFNQYLRSIR